MEPDADAGRPRTMVAATVLVSLELAVAMAAVLVGAVVAIASAAHGHSEVVRATSVRDAIAERSSAPLSGLGETLGIVLASGGVLTLLLLGAPMVALRLRRRRRLGVGALVVGQVLVAVPWVVVAGNYGLAGSVFGLVLLLPLVVAVVVVVLATARPTRRWVADR